MKLGLGGGCADVEAPHFFRFGLGMDVMECGYVKGGRWVFEFD